MVEMSCEEHDRIAASTQFITHTVGRILGSMQLGPTPIDTRGFESLLNLVDNTTNDSFDLYYGLFMYNAVSNPPCICFQCNYASESKQCTKSTPIQLAVDMLGAEQRVGMYSLCGQGWGVLHAISVPLQFAYHMRLRVRSISSCSEKHNA